MFQHLCITFETYAVTQEKSQGASENKPAPNCYGNSGELHEIQMHFRPHYC